MNLTNFVLKLKHSSNADVLNLFAFLKWEEGCISFLHIILNIYKSQNERTRGLKYFKTHITHDTIL